MAAQILFKRIGDNEMKLNGIKFLIILTGLVTIVSMVAR